MLTAIVFVKADVARIPEIAEEIAALPGVSEVYSVTGAIDLIVLVRVAGHEQVADVVADRLNKVVGVRETETHIAFRAYSSHDLEAAGQRASDRAHSRLAVVDRRSPLLRALSSRHEGALWFQLPLCLQ